METGTKRNQKIYRLALIGVMSAVICVLGPISIPLPGLVPISLTNLALYLAVFILGWTRGLISYVVYLAIGLCGVPVFSGFTGGLGKAFGPTGGYLLGFFFLVLIAGLAIDKYPNSRWVAVLGMAVGCLVDYGFGTAWLAYQQQISFGAALASGVIPFVFWDALKIALAAAFGPMIRIRLSKAGLV